MPDPGKLKSLLKLIDDDAGDVRRAVVKELASFGPGLKEAFDRVCEELGLKVSWPTRTPRSEAQSSRRRRPPRPCSR